MSKRYTPYGSAKHAKKSKYVPWDKSSDSIVPEDVRGGGLRAALVHLSNLYQTQNGSTVLPKVAMKHQLYSVMDSRTTVDQGINSLRENGDIKMFKTSLGTDQYCIMFTLDYIEHVRTHFSTENSANEKEKTSKISKTLLKFITEVVPNSSDVSLDKKTLFDKFGFQDSDITELIKCGVLNLRDAGSWWIAIPTAGHFLKLLRKGRQATLQIIRRTKYKELNQSELLARKPPPSIKLGLLYHVHDLIGADLVKCINATTGVILK
uniref:Serine/threonine-protein kinase 19 n=1 Tax=Ciona savignyi TaxID=51511 RepID=H2ZMA7_CIOSA